MNPKTLQEKLQTLIAEHGFLHVVSALCEIAVQNTSITSAIPTHLSRAHEVAAQETAQYRNKVQFYAGAR